MAWVCLVSTLVAAPVKITIFGKGGLVNESNGSVSSNRVCPLGGTEVCAVITMESRESFQDFEEGVTDHVNAKLTINDFVADIQVTGIEKIELHNTRILVYDSPELDAFKEINVGRATGVTFNWVNPVNLMPYTESVAEVPAEIQPIKIVIKGSGGVVMQDNKNPKICPISGKTVCAVVQGSLWDLLSLWMTADPGREVPGKVKISVFEAGRPVFSTTGIIEGLTDGAHIMKTDEGLTSRSNPYKLKFIE